MTRALKQASAILVVALVAPILTFGVATAQDTKEVYEAFAVNMGGALQGQSTTLQIHINRWSNEEDRQLLLNTLKEKGHEEFIKTLRKQKEVGFVRGHGRAAAANPFPSTRVHGAWQTEKDGKREIVLVTDRPIGMAEAANSSRSMDYDTTVLMMDFPSAAKDAEGEGTLYMALKIRYDNDEKKLKVEELGQQPTRLTKIKRTE